MAVVVSRERNMLMEVKRRENIREFGRCMWIVKVDVKITGYDELGGR